MRKRNPKSLLQTLAHTLGWHPQRCDTFFQMVQNLIAFGNIQHHSLSRGISDPSSTLKSRLERVRRFFSRQEIDLKGLSESMALACFGKVPKIHLILDRTNWKFGTKEINFLVLAGRVGSITFPLFWVLLDHRGNSQACQRIKLMSMFQGTFGLDRIKSFTADREFIGQEWITYLCHHNIPFLSA